MMTTKKTGVEVNLESTMKEGETIIEPGDNHISLLMLALHCEALLHVGSVDDWCSQVGRGLCCMFHANHGLKCCIPTGVDTSVYGWV